MGHSPLFSSLSGDHSVKEPRLAWAHHLCGYT